MLSNSGYSFKMASLHLVILLLLYLTCYSANVLAGPIPPGSGSSPSQQAQEVDNEVEQLDQLRRENQRSGGVAVMKSEKAEMVQMNGKQQGKQEKQETVKDLDNDQLLATVKQSVALSQESPNDGPHTYSKTEVNIPSLGVHKVEMEKDGQLSQMGLHDKDDTQKKNYGDWQFQLLDRPINRPRPEDYYTKFAGIQYTPLDLAEYIFRTGDEEGVALAIEELLREGMMTREEAIAYLQDVKMELNIMRSQYERERRFQKTAQSNEDQLQKTELKDDQSKGSNYESASSNQVKETKVAPTSPASTPLPTIASTSESTKLQEQTNPTRTPLPKKPEPSPSAAVNKKSLLDYRDLRLPPPPPPPEDQQDEIDVAAILERLKAANSLYEEYTLEEIIYQLAKDMFTQSVLRGDQSAEEALTKFGNFLEAEVANSRISRDLEQKILDIMSAALVDSLKEFPGVLPVEQTYPGNDPNALFQQLSLGKAGKMNDYPNIERQRDDHRHDPDRRYLLPKMMKHKKSDGGNGHLTASGQSNQSTAQQQS